MRFFGLTAILSIVLSLSFSADEVSSDKVFAPFVRNIRISLKEPQIRITWEDNSKIAQTYIVYRSSEEITQENLDKATKVIEVPNTETSYTDVPPSAGDWFYAVLIKDTDSNIYEILIPFRNKTNSATTISKQPSTEDQSTILTNIKAGPKTKTIEVSIISSRNSRMVSLYRSTLPISDLKSLQNAILLQKSTGQQITYTDTPIPGVPYFYAFVDTEALELGTAILIANKNTLDSPIELVLTPTELAGIKLPDARPIRSFPLPDLSRILGSNDLPQQANIDLGIITESRVKKIIAGAPESKSSKVFPKVGLLPSDRIASAELKGIIGNLQEILTKSFSQGRYSEALEQFKKLNSLGLQGETKIKVRYYTAICESMLERNSEAILNFLTVRDDLAEYVEPWISALIEKIKP